jgi:hypothetical protein
VAPTDQPDIRDGVMGGATRPGGDPRRAVARQTGDAVEACGLNGFGRVIAGRMAVSRSAIIDFLARRSYSTAANAIPMDHRPLKSPFRGVS